MGVTDGGLTRRSFLATTAAPGAASVVPWGTQALAVRPAVASNATGGFAERFRAPGSAARAMFRWWWPQGMVDPIEIRREIDQIADARFGGVEIADVHHSVSEPLDPEGHGWGSPARRRPKQ